MPEDMPDRMPEDMPDRMPEDLPEDMPDRMPDRMPEDMPDRMPQDLPVRKCINVMVGITRSKVIFAYTSWKNAQPGQYIQGILAEFLSGEHDGEIPTASFYSAEILTFSIWKLVNKRLKIEESQNGLKCFFLKIHIKYTLH